MEENFEPVARTRANYYTPGSPVQFVCVELLKGEVSGEHAVCLTFKNISRVTLTALEIHFKCKGVDGVILCEDEFEYRDLTAKPGESFGMDDAVFVTQKAITSVDVTLRNVYSGNKVVHLESIKRVRLPAPRRLSVEMQKALEARMNRTGMKFMPQVFENGWYCACGAFHPKEEDTVYCSECGSDRILLQNALNTLLQPEAPVRQPEPQPAAQPVQSHAPLKAQTEVNGFELPEQEIPKENQKEPPRAAKPPKPKKEKPTKKPRRQPVEEVEDDEENEQPRRRFPFGCLIVLVILALVGFGGYKVSQFYAELDGQKTLGPTQTITVPEGSSVAGIATQLKDAGVIEYDWLFKQYVKYSGKAGEIQYGDFEVQSGMAYNDIIKALSVVTRRATVNVTIPEGTTAVGVAQIFVDAGLVDDVDTFLSCANGNDGTDWSKYDFWNAIPDNDRLMKCEGYLFPDTYNLYKDESVAYYVDALYGEFASKTAALADTVAAKGTSLDDVVKLASFIQEEAGLESEDARVSACFHNRLESSDPQWAEHKLESNASSYIMQDSENNYLWNSPTAEYFGWPEQGAIPDDVLALYDTYAISGLPAGPISCPGYAAMEAALNPDEEYINEGYYFFVTGHPGTDVAGQYFYAKTADEHYQNCVKAGWAS